MGLLKKILKQHKAEERPFIKRAPRVRLASQTVTCAIGDLSVPISNLSISGVGLAREARDDWPDKGSTFQAHLIFPDRKLEVTCKVVHFTESVVGCHFLNPSSELIPAIQGHFKVELSALSLIHVNPKLLKARDDGNPLYFQGKDYSELYFVVDHDGVLEFNASFLGNYLEYRRDEPFRMGTLNIELQMKVSGYKVEEPVHWSTDVDPRVLRDMLKFLGNIEHMQAGHRDDIRAILEFEISKREKSVALKKKDQP